MLILFKILNIINITPLPKDAKLLSDDYYEVDALKWSCTSAGKDCLSIIQTQMLFYTKAFFPKGAPIAKSQNAIKQLKIELQQIQVPKSPLLGNESYKIQTNESGIFVEAFDTYALSRALSSVSQLLIEKPGEEYVQNTYKIQPVEISDSPAFKFRELMVDTSRHFLPVSTLKRQIDALAMSKMNVLHIHLIDSESNAFQPVTKPADGYGKAAWITGGYSYKLFFSSMEEVAEYANSLGVHIMLEYDMPGHATSWREADPDLVANCPGQGYTSVNPLNEKLYVYINAYTQDLVDSVYKKLGKTPIIHLGGDEVDHNCWKSDAVIVKHMKENGLTTKSLWQQFHKRVADIIQKMDQNALRVYWQESFENGNEMNANVIVHAWYNVQGVNNAASAGLNVIRSRGWYLDIQQPGSHHEFFQDSWKDFYGVDVYQGVADKNKKYVLGGGACQWGEKVTDANIDEQTWPRTVATAEILWSHPAVRTITPELQERLNSFTCKLLSVGVNTGPFIPSAPCPGFEFTN